MSIPESVVGAAHICQPTAEVRAKGVILALAESLPDSAVDAAQQELSDRGWLIESPHLRAAIIAALKDIAGKTP